jgi:hypothetical protein
VVSRFLCKVNRRNDLAILKRAICGFCEESATRKGIFILETCCRLPNKQCRYQVTGPIYRKQAAVPDAQTRRLFAIPGVKSDE